MKFIKPILFFLTIAILFSAKDISNPNGRPFLISFGIEKNIDSFKYYNESSYYITIPITNMITFKYRENVKYTEPMVVLNSEHDKIDFFDRYYTLEMHLPFYKLFQKLK